MAIRTDVSFFLDEDDTIMSTIEQLRDNDNVWIVKLGKVSHGTFFTLVSFFANSEKQARKILKVWEESKVKVLA